MSTFECPIVKITEIEKHPNADTLYCTKIFDYNVIIRTGEFNIGDLAVYIPEESLLPDVPLFSWIWTKEGNNNPPTERQRVLRAKKIRGIFSCGILIKVPEFIIDKKEGVNVAEQLKIEKYEKMEEFSLGGDNEAFPPWARHYTDIENARGKFIDKPRYSIFDSEDVCITEKIHGSCSSYLHDGQRMWIFSHSCCKRLDSFTAWNTVVDTSNIQNACMANPNKLLFGEIYGPIQKNYSYGSKSVKFVLFDVFDVVSKKWLTWPETKNIALNNKIDHVPELYVGPWLGLEHATSLADGPTVLGAGRHNREGCVVKSLNENTDSRGNRKILKIIGQEYLLKKGK